MACVHSTGENAIVFKYEIRFYEGRVFILFFKLCYFIMCILF
jgi:hypothetical protein